MDRPSTDLITEHIDRAVDALSGRNGAQMVTETRARHVAEQLAQRAYETGRHAAIRELQTTDNAVATLGITRAYVNRLATRHNIGWHIGRDRLFRPEDIEQMRGIITAATPGRPRTTTLPEP